MKIVYWNRTRLPEEEEKELGLSYLPFEEVLKQSDYLSVNIAYNEHTFHFIGEKEFELMKASSIIINTARGPVIDEKALVKALQNKQIAGAGLDVYEEEPRVEPELIEMDNCVLLPHLASATIGTRTKMGMIAIDNLLAKFSDQPLPNLVNTELL
jgi:glyoxylate reductase